MKLTVHDHPFAHLFDKSIPDPAAKEAAAAERTQDFWEVDAPKGVYIRLTVNQERDIMFQTKRLSTSVI